MTTQALPQTNDEAITTIRAGQNFAAAVPAGIGAAIVGALIWAVFVYVTEIKLGLIAVGIGAIVGYAIRRTGNGADQRFGVLGAICSAFGWATGTLLCDVALMAKADGVAITQVIAGAGLSGILSLAVHAMDFLDILFFAIAVWEGYKLSFRYRLR